METPRPQAGGQAKVAKGFAVAGQPDAEARKRRWKTKARAKRSPNKRANMKGKNMRGNRNRKPGESNPHHTLTRAQVARVRRLAGSARMKYGWKSALARDFGVTPSCIGDILAGRRWA